MSDAYLLLEEGKGETDAECFSDVGVYREIGVQSSVNLPRPAKKRHDIKVRGAPKSAVEGNLWACCFAREIQFPLMTEGLQKQFYDSIRLVQVYSEVIIVRYKSSVGNKLRPCFLFRFGCVAGWDLSDVDKVNLTKLLTPYVSEMNSVVEEDDMDYCYHDKPQIKQDVIHLTSDDTFELLAYSYALAQSCKCAVFETQVDQDIENTRGIPLALAKTGQISSDRRLVSRRIGELFISRFIINLHSDILDTPDIFWDFGTFAQHYNNCRNYLEVPKRVEILNQRLDIIKDLYDMLNSELEVKHGFQLEWLVIYLVFAEVFIEIFWNILLKDLLHWVG